MYASTDTAPAAITANYPSPGTIPHPDPTKKIGVMVATPLREFRDHRDLPGQVAKMFRELVVRPDAKDYSFEFAAACGGLCRARNNCVHEFLKSDNVWLYWRDKDLFDSKTMEADHLLRLLSHRQPIVGGLYCKRHPRPVWVASWIPQAKIQAGGLLQVAELGTGAKLIHRKVFEEIRRIFGGAGSVNSIMYRERETGEMIAGFYQNIVSAGDLLSEDYFLDYLCRCAQIPILADTQVRLRHSDGKEVYPENGKPWPPIPAEDVA